MAAAAAAALSAAAVAAAWRPYVARGLQRKTRLAERWRAADGAWSTASQRANYELTRLERARALSRRLAGEMNASAQACRRADESNHRQRPNTRVVANRRVAQSHQQKSFRRRRSRHAVE